MKNIILLLVWLSSSLLFAQEKPGYFMHPSFDGDHVYFVAEGDIWKVSKEGGDAMRLTTHPGDEMYPMVSPDGKWVAYSATYEGPREVYLIPSNGGQPKRLTYEAMSSMPSGWKSVTEVAYTTSQYSTLPRLKTITVNINSLEKEIMPLELAAEGTFSSDGKTLFFVRPSFHGNVTKRYEGGTARKIWKYTSGDAEAIRLTKDYNGEDHHPTYHDGQVYFLSARDKIMNVWSMTTEGNNLKQHTKETSFDVREVSFANDEMVYRVGADLYIQNLSGGQKSRIDINLVSDFDQLRERWITNGENYITHASLSNSGKSVAITSRGRVFIMPVGEGRQIQVSRNSGVRYRDAQFHPNSEKIVVLSDESGEFEFVEFPPSGMGNGKPISKDGEVLRFAGVYSPDGKWIAYDDLNNDLWLLNTANGKSKKISSNQEGIGEFVWSPNSKWLAFEQDAVNSFRQIWLYNLDNNKSTELTTNRFNSRNPQWSPDGNWIYFLSDRNFQTIVGSPWGTRQPEPYFDRQMKIYQISLTKGMTSPFADYSEINGGGEVAENPGFNIEATGIQERIREVPVPAGNYSRLIVTKQALYFNSRGTGIGGEPAVKMVKIEPGAKLKDFAKGMSLQGSSQNNDFALLSKGRSWFVTPFKTSPVGSLSDQSVNMKGWRFSVDPREDWKQIYTDAWRMERDYFYDRNMHGVDWDAMHEKYLPLVSRVTTRNELSDVIGEMVGELSVLHTSVRGGDTRSGSDNISPAYLGAAYSKVSKGFRIDKIYENDPDVPNEISPLAHPDNRVSVGDIITHIDGEDVRSAADLHLFLRGKAGKLTRIGILTPGTGRSGDTSRDILVEPLSGWEDSNLRYSNWEYTRRLMVEDKGNDELGYVHIRAMGAGNIEQWYRDFYPIFNKKGIIIDVRHNRGGNIDSWILEKLMRKAFFYWKRNVGEPYWNMQYAPIGHMVLLVDEFTASDGEAFAEGFRRLELGKVIGARTWGGEVWLSSANRLSDNGLARAPMMGVYGAEGEWLIEGWGFVPDIEVINMPKATFEGSDAQLDAAIKYLQDLIEKEPVEVPQPPAYPNKSRDK